MADTDQLCALGQQLAAALVQSYGSASAEANLAFLPFGVSLPSDLIQPDPATGTPMVNLAQMQAWLSINFDLPYAISPDDGSVVQPDGSHGSISQFYTVAVTSAQPLGTAGDPIWTRIDAEIAAARSSLGQTNVAKTLVCEPDDWPLPAANVNYWTKFDSSTTQSTSTQVATPVPVVRPDYWMVRSLAIPAQASSSPPPAPAQAPAQTGELVQSSTVARRFIPLESLQSATPAHATSMVEAATERPALAMAPLAVATPSPELAVSRAAAFTVVPKTNTEILFRNLAPVQTVTTSTASTVTIALQHQYVALGYYSAGQPWWNEAFLADPGWFVPGMQQGGVLPAFQGQAGAVYGRPVGMIVVQNLSASGQWSAAAATALGSPQGAIGPLSLAGAIATTATDGVTVTYARAGMQVVALLCSPLPLLPPVDDPSLPTASNLVNDLLGAAANIVTTGGASSATGSRTRTPDTSSSPGTPQAGQPQRPQSPPAQPDGSGTSGAPASTSPSPPAAQPLGSPTSGGPEPAASGTSSSASAASSSGDPPQPAN